MEFSKNAIESQLQNSYWRNQRKSNSKIIAKNQTSHIYASEADVLNMALFGMTAKQWRDANPDNFGNIRDEATIHQLVVLSNLESINAMLIDQQLAQSERLIQLNKIAILQIKSLIKNLNLASLE